LLDGKREGAHLFARAANQGQSQETCLQAFGSNWREVTLECQNGFSSFFFSRSFSEPLVVRHPQLNR
jgi:hypothetical protein